MEKKITQECVTKSIYSHEQSRTKRLIPFKDKRAQNSRDKLNSRTKKPTANRRIDHMCFVKPKCSWMVIQLNLVNEAFFVAFMMKIRFIICHNFRSTVRVSLAASQKGFTRCFQVFDQHLSGRIEPSIYLLGRIRAPFGNQNMLGSVNCST